MSAGLKEAWKVIYVQIESISGIEHRGLHRDVDCEVVLGKVGMWLLCARSSG